MVNRHKQQVGHIPFFAKQLGLSLLELTIVISILALTAAIALPKLSSTDPLQLNKASSELAEAIRFARSEAIRTGERRGIRYFSSSNKFSIYRVFYIFSFPIPIYDIRHPVDKNLYTLTYADNGNQGPVRIQSVTLNYGGSGSDKEYISFDKHGTPGYLSGSTYQMLDIASIVLSYGSQTRIINVSPMTGRVTVQ